MLKQIFVLNILFFALQSCSNSNDKIYSKFKNNLNDSIESYKAKEFDYTYDNLLPQKTFFSNSKVRLLVLKGSGELCDSETNYLFDLKSDSISLVISRQQCFEDPNRWTKKSDTIYIIDYAKKTEENYSDGILTERKKIKNYNQSNEYIFEIKLNTEKKYNSR